MFSHSVWSYGFIKTVVNLQLFRSLSGLTVSSLGYVIAKPNDCKQNVLNVQDVSTLVIKNVLNSGFLNPATTSCSHCKA